MAKSDKKNMAPCPSCNRKIYREVPSCPYCGTEAPFKTSVVKILVTTAIGAGVVILAALASGIYFSG